MKTANFLTHAELRPDVLNFIQIKTSCLNKYYKSDLLMAADTLNELEAYLKHLRKKTKNSGKSFAEYLETFIEETRQRRQKLCEAFYSKLIKTQDQAFKKTLFYITQYGSIETKSKAEQFLFINETEFHLKCHENQYFFIPKELNNLTPKKLRWPNFLFSGYNFRYSFFKDINKYILIEKLLYFSYHKGLKNENLENSKEIILELSAQISRTESQMTHGLFSIFKRKTNRLLHGWKDILLIQKESLELYHKKFIEPYETLHKENQLQSALEQLKNLKSTPYCHQQKTETSDQLYTKTSLQLAEQQLRNSQIRLEASRNLLIKYNAPLNFTTLENGGIETSNSHCPQL